MDYREHLSQTIQNAISDEISRLTDKSAKVWEAYESADQAASQYQSRANALEAEHEAIEKALETLGQFEI